MARPFFWSRQAAVAIAILIALLGYPVRAQDSSSVTDQMLFTLLREHHAAQNFEEALKAARRLAAMRELTLGPNHADTAWAVGNMGIVLVNLGRFAEAEPLLKRGLSVFEATQPYDSSLIYRMLTALDRVYSVLNRNAEAEAILKRQLAIKERSLGAKHEDVISLVSRLSSLATSAGRSAEAEAYFRRLPIELQMQSKASKMTDLARAASRENRWADAMKYMRQVMQIVLEQHHARKKTLYSSSETPGIDHQWLFFIKLAHRLAASGGVDTGALASEMFEAVQWVRTSAASSSVAQMAVRARVSDPRLASLLRETLPGRPKRSLNR